jgi:hypothetical protein
MTPRGVGLPFCVACGPCANFDQTRCPPMFWTTSSRSRDGRAALGIASPGSSSSSATAPCSASWPLLKASIESQNSDGLALPSLFSAPPIAARQAAAAFVTTGTIPSLAFRNGWPRKRSPRDSDTSTMVGVGMQDQLGIRHVLNEVKRIYRVHDDVMISAHDQCLLLDIL